MPHDARPTPHPSSMRHRACGTIQDGPEVRRSSRPRDVVDAFESVATWILVIALARWLAGPIFADRPSGWMPSERPVRLAVALLGTFIGGRALNRRSWRQTRLAIARSFHVFGLGVATAVCALMLCGDAIGALDDATQGMRIVREAVQFIGWMVGLAIGWILLCFFPVVVGLAVVEPFLRPERPSAAAYVASDRAPAEA